MNGACGATILELLIVVGLIALGAMASVSAFGSTVSGLMARQGDAVASNASSGSSGHGGGPAGPGAGSTAAPTAPGAGPTCIGSCGKPQENCFVAGTPVLEERGLVPIEEVRVGDRVVSRDEGTGVVSLRRVAATFAHAAPRLVSLQVLGVAGAPETLRATPEHPFWTLARGWSEAARLAPGDLLLDADGHEVEVLDASAPGGGAPVFNFEVEETHTYFVGATGVWVHNLCALAIGQMEQIGTYQKDGHTIDISRLRTGANDYRVNIQGKQFSGWATYSIEHGEVVVHELSGQPAGGGMGAVAMNLVAQDGARQGAHVLVTDNTAPSAQGFYQKMGLNPDPKLLAMFHAAAPDVPIAELVPKIGKWSAPTDNVLQNSAPKFDAWEKRRPTWGSWFSGK